MFLTSIYFYLFLLNFGALFFSPVLDGLNPLILVLGIYFLSAFILVIIQSMKKVDPTSRPTVQIAERMISNGKSIFFITGLTLFDLLILLLIVPESSVILLENYGYSLLLFSLLFLFTPILLLKFTVENHGTQFENEFWKEFKAKLQSNETPSETFVAFILSRLENQHLRKIQSSSSSRDEVISGLTEDDVITTAYPAGNNLKFENIEEVKDKRNPVFDSEEDLAKEDPIKTYSDELMKIFPHLEKYVNAKPINIRPELLLNIIINQSAKELQIYQLLQNIRN